WQQVLAAFEQLGREVCGDAGFRQVLLDRYSAAWEASTSGANLDAALTFLRSTAGREFVRAYQAAHRAVSETYERMQG
ncbi:hypothetical protein, partial [Bacillus sp. SIMBA_033]|uniref:hypothetical protein n=1 Tax=Bacillus sp. SIMBA_033 TaxID=3085776 RepID=UPI003979D10F